MFRLIAKKRRLSLLGLCGLVLCAAIDLVASDSFVLEGRVIDWNGDALAGVDVQVVDNDGEVLKSTLSGGEGEYRIQGLPCKTLLQAEYRRIGYKAHPTRRQVYSGDPSSVEETVRLWKRGAGQDYYEDVAQVIRQLEDTGNSALASIQELESLDLKDAERSRLLTALERALPASTYQLAAMALSSEGDASHVYAAQAPGPLERVDKPRLAVLEVKSEADEQYWWHGGGEAAQDVFVAELVKSGKFSVIERERVNAIMKEKSLTRSTDFSVDVARAVQIGRLLGVDYILAGSVTEYGQDTNEASAPDIRRSPGFRMGQKNFAAAIDARLFDVSTGEIVWADSARYEDSAEGVRVGGFGGGNSDRRMFDKVMRPAIQDLVASLKAADL